MSFNATLNTETHNRTTAPLPPSGNTAANISTPERVASTALGSLLVVWGIRKRSLAGMAGAAAGAELIRRGVSGKSRLYRTAGVNTAAARKPGSEIAAGSPQVLRSITINRSPEELYNFWRNPANMARILFPFAEITPLQDGVTHWRVRRPLGLVFEWDRREKEEQPGSVLSWESLPGSVIPNRGEMMFKPGPDGTGTEVFVRIQFEPPLGSVGAAVAKTLHKIPRSIAGRTLRRFKSLIETGEIPTLEHTPAARDDSDHL